MRRVRYRMCLVAVILVAILFGVWYYGGIGKAEEEMNKGTLVRQMESFCRGESAA